MQFPLVEPRSEWQAPQLTSLPSWDRAKRVGFDLETCDPNLKKLGPGVRRGDGFIAGFSFCLDEGRPFYVPIRHLGGGNVPDPEAAMRYLRDQAAAFTGELIGANLTYDLDWSMEAGVRWRASRFSDVQVAAALIDSLELRYNLEALAERLDMEGKDELGLREAAIAFNVDPKGELWKLPAWHVGPYGEQDAILPMTILARQKVALAKDMLDEVWDLESRLLPILLRMRRHGVRVDEDRLEWIGRWSMEEEGKALAEVHRATGIRIEVGETRRVDLLDQALRKIGIIPPRTKTGKPSIKDAFLESLELPATLALQRARQMAQLRSTFVEGTKAHIVNGRIHCTLKQLASDDGGARFGRMSCVKPNLQNQPAKGTEIGDLVRSAFLPEEGDEWCSADYAAQEPRMLLHWALKMGCQGAQVAAKAFREDPDTDNHRLMGSLIYKVPQSRVTDKQRKYAKNIFLGLCYGMGSGKLAESVGLPTQRVSGGHRIAGPEAMKLLNRFHEGVPYVRELDKDMERLAKQNGYIRTLLGRVCRFPLDDDGKYDWTRTALNRQIQGSSADQTKQAMVLIEEAGINQILQMHDEVCASVSSREEGAEMARIMREAVTLTIPTKVDVEYGPNWAAAQEIEERVQVPAAEGDGFWDAAEAAPATAQEWF